MTTLPPELRPQFPSPPPPPADNTTTVWAEQWSLHGGVCDNGFGEYRYADYACQTSLYLSLVSEVCRNVLESAATYCDTVAKDWPAGSPSKCATWMVTTGFEYCHSAYETLFSGVCIFQSSGGYRAGFSEYTFKKNADGGTNSIIIVTYGQSIAAIFLDMMREMYSMLLPSCDCVAILREEQDDEKQQIWKTNLAFTPEYWSFGACIIYTVKLLHLTLTLFPSPDAAFNCDTCGCNSHGFSYHCSHCDFDIHTCAQNPLFVTNRYHPHPLQLTFNLPYQTEGFSCDICQRIGSNHWLYRCATCEFDAHMDCAMGIVSSPLSQPQPQLQHHNSFPGNGSHQYQQYGNAVMNPLTGHSVYLNSQSMGAMQGGYQQPAVVNNNNNVVMDAVVQGFVEGAARQAGQSFVQGLMGNGGGGDNASSACDSSFSIGSSILSGAFGDSCSES
ncbi:uncharacterized protein LOC130014825 [Mercurialis annua]|uniref:uncharacterized protein LOC130014825 n=1 Tax=Mercurialis annua TaxID=3986 RepID=UPI0024AE45C0|nr:uncharacterized protein LOC130014825 [Mercurialis annua]